MPVFISHRKLDEKLAKEIHVILTSNGIPCYIDMLDPVLKTSNEITNVIMNRIRQCTHMLAVVSDNTLTSWWVPFEIGVASDSDKRISSFKATAVELPTYLTIWPQMTKKEQLNDYIRIYKDDKSVFTESRNAFASINTAQDFHDKLKRAIGQR